MIENTYFTVYNLLLLIMFCLDIRMRRNNITGCKVIIS